jgi:hypothetical protein
MNNEGSSTSLNPIGLHDLLRGGVIALFLLFELIFEQFVVGNTIEPFYLVLSVIEECLDSD